MATKDHAKCQSHRQQIGFLSELHALKIDLFLRQQGLDTTTPAGKAMFQMMGVFAEFERAMIQERVRAGLARARSEGKRLGRPPIAPGLEKRIRDALATPGRAGVRVIAKQFGVDPGTVQRINRPFEASAAGLWGAVNANGWPADRFRTIQGCPKDLREAGRDASDATE
jgi:DNA invertase Pin-like site-specific DNA recombinase